MRILPNFLVSEFPNVQSPDCKTHTMKKKITSRFIVAALCLLPFIGWGQNDTLPDLVISHLEVTRTNIVENTLEIRYEYRITNIGNATISLGDVNIRAYISQDAAQAPQDGDIFVQDIFPGALPISPGNTTATQIATATVTEFNPPEVPYYLTLQVDAEKIVPEGEEGENNNIQSVYPDQPTAFTPLSRDLVKKQFIIDWDALRIQLRPDDFSKIYELIRNNTKPVAACDCNIGIELVEFDGKNEQEIQAILDRKVIIDGKNQSVQETVERDSDPNQFIELATRIPAKGFEVSLSGEKSRLTNVTREVRVYLLDSGVSTEFFQSKEHPEGWNYLLQEAPHCRSDKSPGYNYTPPPSIITNYNDENGHGTFGFHAITEGLPDNIKVVPIKIFNEKGEGTLFSLLCGIYHAVENADIINISAGYSGEYSELLADALKAATDKGIWVVASTGNCCQSIDIIDNDTLQFSHYPAALVDSNLTTMSDAGRKTSINTDKVISVASLDPKNDKLAKTSNYGNQTVTLAAYGNRVCGYSNKKYRVFYSGTSMATFYVTRSLAIEMANNRNPDFSIDEFIRTQATNKTTDDKMPNKPILNMSPSKPKLKIKARFCNFLRSIGIVN